MLDIQNLRVYYYTQRGPVKAVEKISFQVPKGGALGLAGESGCGKTTLALSILRILPAGGRIVDGDIFYKDMNLVKLDEKQMREEIRWSSISLIFQGAMNALNPVFKVGDQIVEAILIHEKAVNKKEAKERAEKLLEMVGIDPSRASNYPHEFSGGMRQRALIAMALACNPDLLIADEPGTALDVIVQAQILKLMTTLKEKLNLSVMMITHDLSMIAELCETVVIMYAGNLAEYGDVMSIYKEPLHPYTQGLIEAFPSLKSEKREMTSIPGSPPDLLTPPSGCRFHPRCRHAMEICKRKLPESRMVSNNHFVACYLVG